MIYVIENAVISYPHIFVATRNEKVKNSTPRFGANLIFQKDYDFTDLTEQLNAACEAEETTLAALMDGDLSALQYANPKHHPGFEGRLLVAAYAQPGYPPEVLDRDGETHLTVADTKKIFGGCLVNAVVSFYFTRYGDVRLNCGLEGVQLVSNDPKEITRLDGKPNVSGMFKPLPGSAPAPLRNAFGSNKPKTTPPMGAAPTPEKKSEFLP